MLASSARGGRWERLRGEVLLALGAVGADAALALAGEADRTLLAGEGLLLETEAARLTGDFLVVFVVCGAVGVSVSSFRSCLDMSTYLARLHRRRPLACRGCLSSQDSSKCL